MRTAQRYVYNPTAQQQYVVGHIMHIRVASPLYAEASCFRLHEGTILNRTIKTIQPNFSQL